MASASEIIMNILLGLILVTNVVELLLLVSLTAEDEPPELTDEMCIRDRSWDDSLITDLSELMFEMSMCFDLFEFIEFLWGYGIIIF